MKEGWKYKKLGDLCDIYQPATIAASKLSVDGKYPVYGANGIIGRHNEYNHEEAEVLLGCRGTCGVVNMSQPFSWINGNAMVIRPTKDTFSKVFLMYLLRSLDYSHIITGTAQPQITQTTLRPTEVPVPPLSEQQKIVEYLDTSFAKIDAMKANAEKSLEEAKTLFQSSLKELLEPKEGWEKKTIGELAIDIYRGSGVRKDQVTEDGISCVRYGEIYTKYNFHFDKCHSHTLIEYIPSPKYFDYGDIIFAITGESVEDIGKCAAYVGNEKCIAGGDTVVLKHNQNPRYLAYALSTPSAIKQKGRGKTKLKVVHTNIPSLKEIVLPIAPMTEQVAIADALDTIQTKVIQLQANYDKISQECDALKQSILKQVFE